jgi:serine/threonine protein kinase
MKAKDPTDKYGIVRIIDHFQFRKHMVLVFELLGMNLYRYMRSDNFKGLKKDFLRNIVIQVLTSLAFLRKIGVIHCDLKPENILFTDEHH